MCTCIYLDILRYVRIVVGAADCLLKTFCLTVDVDASELKGATKWAGCREARGCEDREDDGDGEGREVYVYFFTIISDVGLALGAEASERDEDELCVIFIKWWPGCWRSIDCGAKCNLPRSFDASLRRIICVL